MPSKADYIAISGSYQIHLDKAFVHIKNIELDKIPQRY